MPLFLHRQLPSIGEIGIWKIQEPERFFLEALQLQPEENAQLALIKGRRRLEWLAARKLVHDMSGRIERGVFFKDEFGKPHLKDSDHHISISHSHEMAAAIASPFSVGIDIQYRVEKITRIEHKFLTKAEQHTLIPATKIDQLHIYWGAKEALYKAYGRKKLDACQHLLVDPFDYDLSQGHCTGKVIKGSFRASYDIYYEKHGPYFLVFAIEQTPS